MPNNCYFKMKITGPGQAVYEFIDMLQWAGPYVKDGLGRVFSFDFLVPDETIRDSKTGYIAVLGEGDCANSVYTSMKDGCGSPRTLESETKRLSLAVEYYSSDTDACFQEHGTIICGKVLEHECIDYHEYFVEGMTENELVDFCKEKGLSQEELMSSLNYNGEYCEGGYPHFGEFSDLFFYLYEFRKDSLNKLIDAQIESASIRAARSQVILPEVNYKPER